MAKSSVRKTLPREDWLAIFAKADKRYVSGRRDRAMYFVMYYMGLRVGEACNLRLNKVDIKRKLLETPMEGKTGARKLGMPDSAMFFESLNLWLESREEIDPLGKSQYFFCTSTGGRVAEQNVRKALTRHAIQAGFDSINPHAMRHSFATEILSEGNVSIWDLKEMLGHQDIATTQVYLHSIDGRTQGLMRARAI